MLPFPIVTFSLNNNKVGDLGATAIAKALEHNSGITELWWVLYPGCVSSFFTVFSLVFSNRLPLIFPTAACSLGSNSIGSLGAIAFAQALERNSTITKME
jgi:hypothetical protein